MRITIHIIVSKLGPNKVTIARANIIVGKDLIVSKMNSKKLSNHFFPIAANIPIIIPISIEIKIEIRATFKAILPPYKTRENKSLPY